MVSPMSDAPLEPVVKIAILETRVSGLKENIDLQAKEYERRLQELNHAHQIQMDRNAQYISREAFELYSTGVASSTAIRTAEIDKWRREIDQWRWISIGAGLCGGGLVAMLARLIGGH